jgi:uncharacterized protein YukE
MLPLATDAAPRSYNSRMPENSRASASTFSAIYSDVYSGVSEIVRALVTPRPLPTGARNAPRNYNGAPQGESAAYYQSMQGQLIQTKAQYIDFLRNSNFGTGADCEDRYNKYSDFFGHDASLSGGISVRKNAPSSGRLDTVCDFLGYAHWCFALGFAYATRNFDDPTYINSGSRCLTYQEFCQSGVAPDNARIDEYLSKIIDEIVFYNANIKNSNRNIVNTVTRTESGTTMGWKGYDTDSWIQERLPKSTMMKLLCK